MRRYLTIATVLAVGSAGSILTSTAGAATLKDCGKLTIVSGFGGGLPKGVPAGSKPRLDGFRVSGKVKCSVVVHVLNEFEAHASEAQHLSDPPAPGWSPCNFIVNSGYVCRKAGNVILVGIVWLKGGHEVGPKPHAPTPGKDRPSTISVACNFIVATVTDSCTATVHDAGSAGRSTPSGSVELDERRRRQLHERKLLLAGAQPGQRGADAGHRKLRSAVQAARDDLLDGHRHLHRRPEAPRQPGHVEHARSGQRRLVTGGGRVDAVRHLDISSSRPWCGPVQGTS